MNFKFPIFNFRLLSVVAASLLVVFISARADDLKIEVTLSETTTAIGEPVELQIKITGVSQLNEPGNLRIDGLDIQFVRQSSQQMLQFGTGLKGGHTTSVTAKYIVTPQREGTFTIPPLSIEVGGKKAASEAVTLKVQKGAGGLAKAEEQAETAFAKIVPARLQAYVGEAVPMEVRIYVDARIQHWGWDRQKPPDLKTDSFTTQKWIGSEATSTAKNGRAYHLLVFRTAITPAKAGKLPVGPGEFKIVVQLPRPKNRRPHMGTGSLFDDDFPDPFGMFQQQQELAVPIKSVDLEVRPLPPGAPKSFAGAVGRFTFLADASPRTVHVGDPVTLTTKISGRGNFDRLPAPRLAEESGWRSYAPAGKFAADDDLGISGTKTFEMAVVPEEKKSTLPAVEFSFFDPVSEKYVTQTAERMTITTEGEKLATAATPAPSGTPPALVPGTAPVAAPSDILYLRTDAGGWSESLQPLFRRRTFWLAQTVPLAALL